MKECLELSNSAFEEIQLPATTGQASRHRKIIMLQCVFADPCVGLTERQDQVNTDMRSHRGIPNNGCNDDELSGRASATGELYMYGVCQCFASVLTNAGSNHTIAIVIGSPINCFETASLLHAR